MKIKHNNTYHIRFRVIFINIKDSPENFPTLKIKVKKEWGQDTKKTQSTKRNGDNFYSSTQTSIP